MEWRKRNVDSVGDRERLGRSFERHLRAENKSPKTVTTYGESVAQLRTYLAGEGVLCSGRCSASTWRVSWSTSWRSGRPPSDGVLESELVRTETAVLRSHARGWAVASRSSAIGAARQAMKAVVSTPRLPGMEW
jgi:hypothetical protein